MRLKRNNIYYIIGIVPLSLVVTVFALILSYEKVWLFYTLLILASLILYSVVRKFNCLPRPLREYKDLRPIKLNLPVQYDVQYVVSKDLDQYAFLGRVVEIISPLYMKKGEKIRVVISEEKRKTYGDAFIKMAVCRELEKYRSKSAVKILLSLITPVLAVAAVTLAFFVFKIDVLQYFNYFVAYFLFPFLATALLLSYLFFWNKYVTKEEVRLDTFLISHFSKEDVEKYIKTVEVIEGGDTTRKHQDFEKYYTAQRIKKLKR